jgi:hypothetical protein
MTASNIQGTGVQNLLNALRMGCAEMSGMEFGPNLCRRLRASSVDSPVVDKFGRTAVAGRGDEGERMAAGVITRGSEPNRIMPLPFAGISILGFWVIDNILHTSCYWDEQF